MSAALNCGFEFYVQGDSGVKTGSYYRIPKILFTCGIFNELSAAAKILFAALLSTNDLSKKNGWKDKEEKTYINYTIKRTMELLHCGDRKAKSAFDELLGANLILKMKHGLGMADRIYLRPFKDFLFLSEQNTETFYRLPKFLFECEYYAKLSSEAILLYAALLDRTNLSLVNNWKDKNDRIYINFQVEEAQKTPKLQRT
jgi:hypothetical protein